MGSIVGHANVRISLLVLIAMLGAILLPALLLRMVLGLSDECFSCSEECCASPDTVAGVNYLMVEAQARTWHRNRWARPYSFALRQ